MEQHSGQCALWILLCVAGAAGCCAENASSDVSLASPVVQSSVNIEGWALACAKTIVGHKALQSMAQIASNAMIFRLADLALCIRIFYQLRCEIDERACGDMRPHIGYPNNKAHDFCLH